MSHSDLPIHGLDEVRQANRLFLGYLRSRPDVAVEHFGLPAAATDLLRRVTADQLDQAAAFPRALFRLNLPAADERLTESLSLGHESGLQILQLALLLGAWSLARASGYSARLLLRLDDASVERFRAAEMADVLEFSRATNVVRAAYEDFGWIWQELIAEARPERRQRLLLLGLQPNFSLRVARGAA